jgi:putative hydrolase of the HAD superfamily
VTFDLWQTLIFDNPEDDGVRGQKRCENLQRVLSGLGIALPLSDLQRAREESTSHLQAVWRRNGEISTIDQIQMIVQVASGRSVDLRGDSRTVEMLQTAYVDSLFALNEDAKETLEGMKERVHKIGLISNTGRSPGVALRRFLEGLGVLKFLDVTVFSDEVKCRKPNRGIFDMAARELGARPGDIVHIGDNPEADIWGAKQAGMRAVLYDYPVPEEFKRKPGSLFALSRTQRQVPDSQIVPDARIASLKDALGFVDSLP